VGQDGLVAVGRWRKRLRWPSTGLEGIWSSKGRLGIGSGSDVSKLSECKLLNARKRGKGLRDFSAAR